MNYLELARLSAAEIVLLASALMALGAGLGGGTPGDSRRRGWLARGVGVGGCLLAIGWLLGVAPEGATGGGMLVSDALTRWVKVVLLALTLGTLLVSSRSEFTSHAGEYVAVVLLGAVGMLWMAGTENVLMMFLALELASVALYILTGFNKDDPRGAEAALKYFLLGGTAAAFLLFGLSLVYGATGAIEFRLIAAALAVTPVSPLFLAGLVMVLAGLGFKVAAVPFHFWAPDAYEGAPTPAAGFIATGSKVASFFLLAKLTAVAFAPVDGSGDWGAGSAGWVPVLAWVAAASMIWGNLAALAQRNVKRLLAYSAVAHAGYALVGIVAGGTEGVTAVLYYATAYGVTAFGAFAVIGFVEQATGGSDFEHLAGLGRRAPRWAVCLAVFILALAGIPPLAGFFGKFYVFLAALNGGGTGLGLLWLVALGAATTCVSFYYYLRVLKAVFVEEPRGSAAAWPAGGLAEATIVLAALVVVVAGCAPSLLLSPLQKALVAAGL